MINPICYYCIQRSKSILDPQLYTANLVLLITTHYIPKARWLTPFANLITGLIFGYTKISIRV